MKPVSKLILVLAGVSFLAITLSGFHLHADAPGHGEMASHQHVHSYVGPPELDEDHIDICVFDAATGFSKGEVVALVPGLIDFEPAPPPAGPSSINDDDPLPRHNSRWRPELRGPPSPI